jgi:hypothetical protein
VKSIIIIILVFLLMGGCSFHREPPNNRDFHHISTLYELAGVYKNIGAPSGYITMILWPDIKQTAGANINHEDIEFIEVIPDDRSLIVKAIRKGCSIFEKTYMLGQDFKINDGKIIIRREAHLLTRGGDDVLLGPSYENIVLGIDDVQHGKSRRSGYAAGLVFMIFPVAFSDTSDVRYERVSEKPHEFKNCDEK